MIFYHIFLTLPPTLANLTSNTHFSSNPTQNSKANSHHPPVVASPPQPPLQNPNSQPINNYTIHHKGHLTFKKAPL